jgi:type II secretory ATPase GspE/PulE/Tfp pilus assembly ATPase PilB-like protein
VISTGHASSPIDLLERLKSMNIDLKTQFRALRCILGVKRVPILCSYCKIQVVLHETDNRALKLYNLYRIVSLSKSKRRQVMPILCMPPENPKEKCTHCVNGYIRNHTIYEYLYITPETSLEELRRTHTYTTEETLLSLIMEGSVNPLYLESIL